jgi:hypothetical protein
MLAICVSRNRSVSPRPPGLRLNQNPYTSKAALREVKLRVHEKRVSRVSACFDGELQLHFVKLCFPAAFFGLIVIDLFLKDRHHRNL